MFGIPPDNPSEEESQTAPATPEITWLSTVLFSPNGALVKFSIQGSNPKSAIDTLVSTIMYAFERYKMTAVKSEGKPSTTALQTPPPAAPREPSAFAATQPPAPEGEAPHEPQATSHASDAGTMPLKKLIVQPDGIVEFYIGPFKWPLKDHRGADIVVKLFDADLGVTEAMLKSPLLIEGPSVAGIMVEWKEEVGASGKPYKNVKRVFRQK